jgi:hypothetical protein
MTLFPSWVAAQNIGIWDQFKAWQSANPFINPNSMNVTILVQIDINAIKRLGQWQPPQ